MNRLRLRASAFALITVAALFSGCAIVSGPYEAAETAEQKAFALYGTFVVFEERGAAIINDARVPLDARRSIQRADNAVKPVADATLEAALEVQEIRTEVSESENLLQTAVRNLESWIVRLDPLVANLVAAVKGAD